ncbi:hypothetical protein SAMN05192583_3178 [Sphingomonas gellani]|uniref:MetA-pathway of phenol degradation n=1 Tax=Sphingomonas gellani TaxID=1166340 RepID=A0A1H8I0R7_9SPHN|nr:hypothetical protein [Sphingomonas gellani]SEN62330.1 hypothetical protein SAMN05192583_3178 [Sphingomonas gellani]
MRTVAKLIGAAILVACPSGLAWAQQAPDGAPLRETVGYDVTPSLSPSPLSPSNATTTVSPSSVPQAMERMDEGAVADVSLGTLYAGGDFGTGSHTSIWSSAVGARLRLGDWKLSASLPWMRIRSRSTIFTGIDATPVLVAPNTSPIKRTADGFGDLTLGAAYTIAPEGAPVEVELSGRAKLNTATKSSGLSSGENDYALGADVSVPMGRVIPFASFTYRFLGDTATYRLRDGPAASAGASYSLGSDSFLLASYHYSRAATRFVGDAHELFAGASTRLARTPIRVTGFVTAGLSSGAADAAGGVALSYGFGSPR